MKAVCVALFAGLVASIQLAWAADAAKEKVLHSFGIGTDGLYPAASVIDVKGTLYGTTEYGGANKQCSSNGYNGCGTVFSLNPKTGKEKVLHSFGAVTNDGEEPIGNLIEVKGTLYGTTYTGGAIDCYNNYGCGTVFAIDPHTGKETVVYSFGGEPDGEYPPAGLIDVKGTFYGTTQFGGANGDGTVFALDPGTGTETVLHSFAGGTDGDNPLAGVIAVNGMLYGTTQTGGTSNDGTIFSVDPSSGTETVLHSFVAGSDGFQPFAGLIDVNGTLYGTTSSGGANANGTVFAYDLNTGEETTVYSFCGQPACADGLYPLASLIAVKGKLYGTTSLGGIYGAPNCNGLDCGTLFALDPKTGAETVLHSFGATANDGERPAANLIEVKGTLYGTTTLGSSLGLGTVFSLKP